jgi:hypothetical protein
MDVLRMEEAEGKPRKGHKQSRLFLRKLAQKEMPVVYLPSRVVVKDLARSLGAKLYHVINVLKQIGVFTSVQQQIPFHTAAKVAEKYGYVVKRRGFYQGSCRQRRWYVSVSCWTPLERRA